MADSIKMDGKALADDILTDLKIRADCLKLVGVTPCLAVISSEDDASKVYIRQKEKACKRLGITFKHFPMSNNAMHLDYIDLIEELNNDESVHGIIIQQPMGDFREDSPYVRSILNSVDFRKDVDGLTLNNLGNIWASNLACNEPCTPKGIVRLLKKYLGDLTGKHVVILGRSNLVGKPLAGLLLSEDCTVTICHSKTEKPMRHIYSADILVTAMGDPNIIKDLPYGIEALVDVSMNRDENGKLIGDIPRELYDEFKYYTPVPGGVGPMTVAMLMENVVEAAECTIL